MVKSAIRRWGAAVMWAAAACALLVSSATAQPPDDLRIRYNSGQPVLPVFEGWQKLEDGTFDMVFGYFNRNYVEEVIVPVGPANNLAPEGPDLGQPAYFYPRLHRFVFRVNVPADWGTKELVWTVTANGKTERAFGSLAPRWEIDPLVEIQNSGGGGPDETTAHRMPGITIEPVILPRAPSPPASERPDRAVTFTRDVAPILQRACQSCHRPGTSAPMPLVTYDDARPWAASIRAKVAAREMPPWHIVRNVGIEKFKDDPSLSEDEIATIVKWVDSGAARGNPADLPPARQFAGADMWHIGKPDLVVTATAHKVPASGADWWGVYTVPSGLTEDRYIKAVEAKPGSAATSRAVHHILAYAEEAPSARRAATATRPANDNPFSNGQFLVEYSVGKGGERFPEGSGRLLKAGSTIRFELHYHPVGEEMTDSSQIAFVFYPRGYVPKHIQHTRGLGHGGQLDIPGGADYVRSDGYTRFDSAGVLTGFQPHMHARGKAQCLELIYPTGGTDDNVEQIACAKFEFGSVMVYNWAEDVRPIYPAGTILHVINWHDNSPNRNNPDSRNWVGNGNRTIDEMSFSWVNYYNLTGPAYRRMLAERQAARNKGTAAAVGAGARVAPLPVNVPVFTPSRPPAGLSVSVIVYRGPAAVSFDPGGFQRVKDGEVVVKAIFSQPGTYVLQAIASDGMLRTARNMTITVSQPSEQGVGGRE